ncbi:adenylate/guanylate cyclase domain-containing protein [Nocardioides zeae]|uniref:Adenylate/guanylate cyclase domain-containing protein n=1 Tax=Nocardioides imazamoxiresistens TaxID=3231893 RepID=A0ABU3Q004_9ACTN|nr:adenylate/guanylate cyclase domain-containing protein [Nocardioides zeae]MDT9594372.1 adenylate/guanylate cyclase domain-containing protein [Nocardioides zeae]
MSDPTAQTLLVVGLVLLVVALVAVAVLAVLWSRARRAAQALAVEVAGLREELQRPRGRGGQLVAALPAPREAVRAVWETVERVRDQGVGGALRSSVEELAGWAQVERPDLVRLAARDGRVAILFSDIEGSTPLNESLGDRAWVRLLARHDRVVRRAVEARGGQVVKTQGDGFMVAFGPADDAVAAACAVQQALEGRGRRRAETRVRVRIGIHRGSVLHRENDLFGRNVAYAARVAGLARGGEVLVSDAVATDLVDPALRARLTEPREAALKGLEGTHLLHRVRTSDP